MATTLKRSTSLEKNNKNILGKGGYGIVYEDIWNGRKVAVKQMLLTHISSNEREEEALKTLHHPNVIKLFHVENDEYFKYYALELCEASLEKRFLKDEDPKKYRGPMPSENQVFLQLAKGLEYIHLMELIHRDIKPQNVLISVQSDRKKVTMKWADFGLSKPVNERGTCSMSEVSGTYNWLAPELLKLLNEDNLTEKDEKKRGNVKSDVFAEGLVFGYYLLGGKHPYGTQHQIPHNILTNNPVNQNGIKQNPIHDIITEMLKTNPDDRISSSDVYIKISNIVLEHMTFDKLDVEYKKIERKLAEAYEKSFANIRKEMIEEAANKKLSVSFKDFEEKLRNELQVNQLDLDKRVEDLVNEKGKEKWKLQFENMWENNKRDQEFNWKCNLKNSFDTIFNYEKRVEEYKKKMRQEINEFFKSTTNPNVSNWTKAEKNKIFDEMFDKLLKEVQKEFPRKEVAAEIIKVYEKSIVIKSRQIPINFNLQVKKSHGILHFLGDLKKQFPSLFGSEKENKIKNSVNLCADSVDKTIKNIANGKLCYSDSIISEVIRSVDEEIIKYKIEENYSKVQQLHEYGMRLTIDLMENIERKWERENSVPAKLESNRQILRNHFMMVSEGVAKTKLFASNMAATLEKSIKPAFEKEMVQKTFKGIRNEPWLYDARHMQKHMDLFLIELLEDQQLDKVLDHIRHPQEFYVEVLHRFIAKKIVNVNDEWRSFLNHLTQSITQAATVQVNQGRAQNFVDQLRKEFLKGYLQSEILGSAFLIDCSNEYEDCDNDDPKEFQNVCLAELMQVIEEQISIQFKKNYAKELSPKVVRYMITLNVEAALPRCDECCRLCKSLCIEAANHDTKEKPHDAIHQPDGVAGFSYRGSDKLSSKTCSQSFEQDEGFYLNGDPTVKYKYRDFAKVFPGWKDPRINEELPLREYIMATYNEEIAEKYNLIPADYIPASYSRDLSSIKQQLKREIENC